MRGVEARWLVKRGETLECMLKGQRGAGDQGPGDSPSTFGGTQC